MRGLSTTPRQTAREDCISPRHERGAVTHRVAVDLSPRDIERIAAQVVQFLLGKRDARREPQLLSAGELARRLRVERPWVYRHRELLGGLRIGTGPKAQWRFEYETAVEALGKLQATRRDSKGL